MINVRERLKEMRARPVMWAATQEGFILQVLLLLEFEGLDGRIMFNDPMFKHYIEMRENINDKVAGDIVDIALGMLDDRR